MATVEDIAVSVDKLAERIDAFFKQNGWQPNQMMSAIFGWAALPMTSNELSDSVRVVASRIRNYKTGFSKELGEHLGKIAPKADWIAGNVIPNIASDPDAAIGIVISFLNWVERGLPPRPAPTDWEVVKDKELPRDLKRRLRAIAAHLTEMEPLSGDLQEKIDAIQAAHEAAEQLPTDMEELQSKRADLRTIYEEVSQISKDASSANSKIMTLMSVMKNKESEAIQLIKQCEAAYSVTTTKGLAGAFQQRATRLGIATFSWVFGLILALSAGVYIGSQRFDNLQKALQPGTSNAVLVINVLMAALGIGAPVWFAWISTKQIGQNFRLAEDYAFKASVAKAYEGYKKEAARIDPNFESRLFGSALTRLEEAPLRLVESSTPSSPLQEFLENPTIRKALEGVPNIKEKIIALIPDPSAPLHLLSNSLKSKKSRNVVAADSAPEEE